MSNHTHTHTIGKKKVKQKTKRRQNEMHLQDETKNSKRTQKNEENKRATAEMTGRKKS